MQAPFMTGQLMTGQSKPQSISGLTVNGWELGENCIRHWKMCSGNACIAYPQTEDEYLTRDSVHFHSRLGYRMVGQFFQCGYKFGRWYDMVWMEKHIAPHLENQPPVRTFDQVRPIIREKYQIE